MGAGILLVPASAVERLAEYPVGAPPPGVHRYVAGIGRVDGAPVLSLSLVPHPRQRRRDVLGALLVCGAQPDEPRWALEVLGSAGFVRLGRAYGTSASPGPRPPR